LSLGRVGPVGLAMTVSCGIAVVIASEATQSSNVPARELDCFSLLGFAMTGYANK